MSVTVTINLQTVSQDEMQSLITMLQDYDRRAMRSQVAAGDFEEVPAVPSSVQSSTLLGDPNAREAAVADAATLAAGAAESLATRARRGRPRKDAVKEVAAEQADPTSCPQKPSEPSSETSKPSQSPDSASSSTSKPTEPVIAPEFEAALAEYATLLTGRIPAASVSDTITVWRSKGPECLAQLQEAIEASVRKIAGEVPAKEAPTTDQLRDALQAYVKSHDMEAALTMLNEKFSCQRVSDVAALPIEKQHEFLAACNA